MQPEDDKDLERFTWKPGRGRRRGWSEPVQLAGPDVVRPCPRCGREQGSRAIPTPFRGAGSVWWTWIDCECGVKR